MRFSISLAAILVLLLGCPATPPDGPDQAGGDQGSPQGGSEGAGTTPQIKAGEVGPSAEALLQHKQADLKGQPDTVTLSGEIKCIDGSGPFWLHLFPPPEDPNNPDAAVEDGATPSGPLTGLEVTAPGTFSLLAPKGGEAMLLAFEDVDKDGFPGAQEPVFFFKDRRPLSLEADHTSLSLTCFKLMSPAPDEVGPPPGGEQGQVGQPGGKAGPSGVGGAAGPIKGQKGKGQKGKAPTGK